jgi:hypothetical protein
MALHLLTKLVQRTDDERVVGAGELVDGAGLSRIGGEAFAECAQQRATTLGTCYAVAEFGCGSTLALLAPGVHESQTLHALTIDAVSVPAIFSGWHR